MRTRVGQLAALLLMGTVALAACGEIDTRGTGGHVASSGGRTPSTPSAQEEATDGALSDDEIHLRLLEYAQCLRDHGVDVEDPAPGEGIQIQIDGDPARADVAMKECEDLAPLPPPNRDTGEEREDMLVFAQCMRDNGVEHFADPKPGEGINIGPDVVEDPDFQQAEETCHEELFGGQPDTEQRDS